MLLLSPILNTTGLTRDSDEWWVQYLVTQLHYRNKGRGWNGTLGPRPADARPGTDMLWDYYRGEPPLPRVADGWAEALYSFLRMSRMNYSGMAIRSIAERLKPIGWYTAVDSDPDGDIIAAEIAGKNEFEIQIGDVVEEMLWAGETYMMVSPNPDRGEKIPLVTSEDPRQCIVYRDKATRKVIRGLKIEVDEWDGSITLRLFKPGSVRVAKVGVGTVEWVDAEKATLPDRVALVPVTNKGAIGEFERHLDVLDRINDGIFGRVTIAKYQAFRQRAVKLPERDQDGNIVDYEGAFTSDPGAMWQVPLDAGFWESTPVDLGPIRLAIRDDVEGFAQAVGIPLNWLSSDAANMTATGSNNSTSANKLRSKDRQARVNVALAEVFSQCFQHMGDKDRAEAWKITTLWAPVDIYSPQEMGAAAVAYKNAGMPFDEILVDVFQKSPGDIARIKALKTSEALFNEMLSPIPDPNQQQPGQPGQQDAANAANPNAQMSQKADTGTRALDPARLTQKQGAASGNVARAAG